MRAGSRAVFLDRDGVLNDAPVVDGASRSPRSPADLHLLPGVAEATAALHRHGFVLVVVTNQPDLARGRLSLEDLESMHEELRARLPIDRIYVCPHDTGDGCRCRKPHPGLLEEGAADLGIDLTSSWMVGDRWVDVGAGRAAGTQTILVARDYSWRPTSSGGPPADLEADHEVADLPAASRLILAAE